MDRIVIVGAGVAGLRAAERLRELRFAGDILVVGDERHRPYHRPPLSKAVLSGESALRDILLPTYEPLWVQWRTGVSALRLDPARHTVTLTGDEELRYDGLVIATGVAARRPAGIPWHDARVHVLRTIEDAASLRHDLIRRRGPVVIIGSGLTACETAAAVRRLGHPATLVCRAAPPLHNILGSPLSARVMALQQRNGVRVEVGTQVRDWACGPDQIGLLLADGRQLAASTVVVAAGSVPAVHWLRDSGLTLADGILCKPTCHAVGVTDIVAAGDVASWPNVRFTTRPHRVEHWINAVEMGRAAAENLLAGPARASYFQPLPRFWSEQFGVRLQAAGELNPTGAILGLHAPVSRASSVAYVTGDRLTGLVSWNDAGTYLDLSDDIARQHPVLPRETAITWTVR
ncbi:NAD(P)/FAD-dependent oxidoreductase [Fodinicola acaciae]|uniref:NAD(P)/FAD-dependent oxidoreductase n=1 Tax=Fodinicola acaciae TaxID=2681555 RepID=UPI0013D63D97|nr:FAD-dependent oxidoreductase [Fodinicola acaciae]